MADLETMVLGKAILDPDEALGHHHNQWYPTRHLTGPRPQPQAEMARIQYKDDALRGYSNELDLTRPDSGRLANTDCMPPLPEWNQKKVGH